MNARYAPLLAHFLLPQCFATTAAAQVLLSDSLLQTMTVAELAAEGIGSAHNPIEVYRITYATVDPFGQPTIASGAVVLPISQGCYHPLGAYMHGTVLARNDVPSRMSNEILVGYYLGAYGYVGVLPDYLGLGDSPGPHPYIHAASEASASLDMLRAARELCALKGVQLNGQLFLLGYSQGGHACMATHRLIEQQAAQEFTVTASAPCSGPYDVSGVQAAVMTSFDPYPAPYYLPYVIFSYKYVYPWLYDDVSQVLKEPYATLLPPLFQGNNGSGVVDDILPEVPREILTDSILAAYESDPDHPFRLALRDNDLYNWVPQRPVRMYYCEGDDHVFYQNSLVALQAFQANGAPSVSAHSAGASLDHVGCAFPAMLSAKIWFDGLKGPCDWNGVEERDAVRWSVFPNPARDLVRLVASDARTGQVQWNLLQSDGRIVSGGRITLQFGEAVLALPALPPGLYVLRLDDGVPAGTVRVVIE